MSSQYISKLPKDVVVFEDYELRHSENCPNVKWGLFFHPRSRFVYLTGEWSDSPGRIQAVYVDEIEKYMVFSGTEHFEQAVKQLKKWLRKQAAEMHLILREHPLKVKSPILVG